MFARRDTTQDTLGGQKPMIKSTTQDTCMFNRLNPVALSVFMRSTHAFHCLFFHLFSLFFCWPYFGSTCEHVSPHEYGQLPWSNNCVYISILICTDLQLISLTTRTDVIQAVYGRNTETVQIFSQAGVPWFMGLYVDAQLKRRHCFHEWLNLTQWSVVILSRDYWKNLLQGNMHEYADHEVKQGHGNIETITDYIKLYSLDASLL